MRFLLRLTLEGAGHEVVEANHGAIALERATAPPDLVITDLMMPVMGGRELSTGSASTRRRPRFRS